MTLWRASVPNDLARVLVPASGGSSGLLLPASAYGGRRKTVLPPPGPLMERSFGCRCSASSGPAALA